MSATLEEYMVALGRAAKVVSREYTTTSSGTTTTLITTEFAGLSQATALNLTSVLITSGANDGEVRAAARPVALNTSTNTLTVASAFTNAVASGVTFRLSWRVPWFDTPPGRAGLREISNDALERLWVEDRVTLTAVTGQQRYTLPLTTYWWLDDPSRILKILNPTNAADEIPTTYGGRCDFAVDGETIYLDFHGAPWQTGKDPVLVVHRPAHSRLKIGGVWTDQDSATDGLTLPSESALSTVRDVRIVGLSLLYRALADKAPGEETDHWMRQARHWAGVASRLKAYRVPRDRETNVVNLRPTVVGRGRGIRVVGSHFV